MSEPDDTAEIEPAPRRGHIPWESIGNWLGLALLLVCFAVASSRVFFRSQIDSDPNRVVIRFAHWQLEGGVREGFDAVIKAYQDINPHVTVEQIGVPSRVFANWVITRLVGDAAPDLVTRGNGIDDDRLARYVEPLNDWVARPNPYNTGTDLEGVPWRDTFVDGLRTFPGYSETLLNYYGIPVTQSTGRLFINMDLFHEIMGPDQPLPRTYDELLAVAKAARLHQTADGQPLIPIAAWKQDVDFLMSLFTSQTQKVRLEMDEMNQLGATGMDVAIAYQRGQFTLDHPSIRSGLTLIKEVSTLMQPGFVQVERDQPVFLFMTGQALMTYSGAWDAGTFTRSAPFRVGIFAFPRPGRDDPRYGAHTLGQESEGGGKTQVGFVVTKASKHKETAIDFMQFLTSKRGMRIFCEVSNWMPPIVKADLPDHVRPFAPLEEGYPRGFELNPEPFGFWDVRMLIQNKAFELVSGSGSVDRFLDELKGDYLRLMKADMERAVRSSVRNQVRQDTSMLAFFRLARLGGDDAARAGRAFDELIERQNGNEAGGYWNRFRLKTMGLGEP